MDVVNKKEVPMTVEFGIVKLGQAFRRDTSTCLCMKTVGCNGASNAVVLNNGLTLVVGLKDLVILEPTAHVVLE